MLRRADNCFILNPPRTHREILTSYHELRPRHVTHPVTAQGSMPGTERDISPPTGPTQTTPHSSDPKTPRTTRIQDILGEANMGSIETIFKELVSMLKGLPTGGYQSLLVSVKAARLTQRSPGNFMCEKSTFHDAITLAEHGLSLASQALPPLANSPDAALASILAGIQAVETKVDNLLLDTADKAAERTKPPQNEPKKATFAQATQKGVSASKQAKPTTLKSPKPQAPPHFPTISLVQSARDKVAFAEITTLPHELREKINRSLAKAILEQHPTGPPKVSVRAIARNRFTGEIQLQFLTRGEVESMLSPPPLTLTAVNTSKN
ncbi:hypothetical protein CROQUDRAFT_90387 [Cronartium quercuum f. sp. fusiforme G11]|uniref:Uncharacterized protein n=1 Tax=Cronartium quercuum f. sp. fusiforme G11 TaxID=708437 RepID=A0A9P6NK19_9BASI|nr:hypothetical protein CROQUDRAFT_90387 [Cronartium quercuum f. sp. fusiforme G11]